VVLDASDGDEGWCCRLCTKALLGQDSVLCQLLERLRLVV
jgi:hypothetical protein